MLLKTTFAPEETFNYLTQLQWPHQSLVRNRIATLKT